MATVRRAAPEDARTIADIQIETWRDDVRRRHAAGGARRARRRRAYAHLGAIGSPSTATAQFVVGAHGAEVGFVSAGPCRHEDVSGEVYAIYVRPEAWGTGSGWALMDAAVDWLAERWQEAILWVAEENPRARRFYERYGWVAETTRVEEVLPGAERPRGALPPLRPRPSLG